MVLVLVAIAGAGYGGYVVYQKANVVYKKAAAILGIAKNNYGRGAGIPMVCGPGEEQNGALCYPECKAGYNGVGPVCWQTCAAEFRDDGAFCAKPEPYGRGAGYPIWDEEKCNREHASHHAERVDIAHSGDCEKTGAMWYPKCREGFHNVGCCICSPNCPPGMPDIGVSCTKDSYGRTAGTPLHACKDGYEKDGALCYPLCKTKFKGVGPVCWEET